MQESVPEFYADALQITTTPFGVNMTFSLREPHPVPGPQAQAKEVVRVRTSLEHAKVLTMLLRQQLRGFEGEAGIKIALPPEIYTQLGIAEEDWEM